MELSLLTLDLVAYRADLLHLRISQVIPITDAMKEPRKFPKVLTGVMLFLMGEYQCGSDLR